MAFQIRRGLQQNLSSVTPAEGELLYTTDTKKLYVGNNQGTADLVTAPVTKVNGYPSSQYPNTEISLTTSDIPEPLIASNKYFTDERAQDAVGAALTAGTHSGITFTYGSTQDGANRIDATVTSRIASGDANTIGSIPYYDTASTLSYTTNLDWNNGTSTLTVKNGAIDVTAGNSNRKIFTSTTYANDHLSNSVSIRKARGNDLSPATIQTGDAIGVVSFDSYTTSGWGTSVRLVGSIDNRTVSAGIAPGLFTVFTQDTTGAEIPRLRADSSGIVWVGPYASTDAGSGAVFVRGAANTTLSTVATIAARNTSNTAGAGSVISLSRHRGTYASPTAVQLNDTLSVLKAGGWDGASGTASAPTITTAASIEVITEGNISTGVIPGSVYIKVANNSGVLGTVAKFQNPTAGSVGTLSVTGIVSASLGLQTASYTTGGLPTLNSDEAGMIVFDRTTNQFKGWTGSAWVTLN